MRRVFTAAKHLLAIAVVAGLSACGQTPTDAPTSGVQITDGFVRTPMPTATATAGYLTLIAAEDDVLLSASIGELGTAEIHTMAMEDGVMRMRKLDALALPAGVPVALAPGGDHLMIFASGQSVIDAKTVPVVLTLEKAGVVTVNMPVRAAKDPHAH